MIKKNDANNPDNIYFNFPLSLLKGVKSKEDVKRVMNNIINYCFAEFIENDSRYKGRYSDEILQDACLYYLTDLSEFMWSMHTACMLYRSKQQGKVKVGLRWSVLNDFYLNEKSEFEVACLLGSLALKSIIGTKPYAKTNNGLFISRMSGEDKTVKDFTKLRPFISKFNNEYQLGKIKMELILNWKLKHYSRYVRGFYVSFTVPLEELILVAESNRISNRKKQQKITEKTTLNKVMEELKK